MKARKMTNYQLVRKDRERFASNVRKEIGEKLADLETTIDKYTQHQAHRQSPHVKSIWGGIAGCLHAARAKFDALPVTCRKPSRS